LISSEHKKQRRFLSSVQILSNHAACLVCFCIALQIGNTATSCYVSSTIWALQTPYLDG
jgi:hypothetical protein